MTDPPRLTHEEFFTSLTTLLTTATTKEKSTVYLTQKPLRSNTTATATALLLIRATNGKSKDKDGKRDGKVKISTVVGPDELQGFFDRYAEVAKGSMGSLKKRDRKKRGRRRKGKEGKEGKEV